MKEPARTFLAIKAGDKLELTAPKAYRDHIAKCFGDGEEVSITIEPAKRKRSVKQNAWFHAAITPWAQEEGIPINELKRDLLGEVFGWSEKVSPLSEQRIPLKEHTSELTVEEFSLLMERTVQLAAECGVLILLPDEYRAEQAKRWKKGGRAA